MRTRENLLFHTFIGLKVEIIRSHSRPLEGLSGTIIDETKNLLVIENALGVRKIPKTSCTFRFFLSETETLDVEGRDIAYRPEERAKKLL